MLDKRNHTTIDADELGALIAERDRLTVMCADAIKSGEELADERDRLKASNTKLTEVLQGIIDWCDFALSNAEEFNKHGARNLDGPCFDKARAALSKARGP